MSIIIIGNGSSLLDIKNGSTIDNFDIVVRFNAYTINGYEDYVGTKTHYWFNTINFQNKDTEQRLKCKYKRIYLHSWEWNPEKDSLYKTFVEHYNLKNDTTNLHIQREQWLYGNLLKNIIWLR